MTDISFNNIKQLFDDSVYDIGYLTNEELIKLLNFPIKFNAVADSNNLQLIENKNIKYALIFIKQTLDYDYSMRNEILEKLSQIPLLKTIQMRLNFKMASVIAGMGQYGKNQLLYNYKFGFDIHIEILGIYNNIIDLPIRNIPNFNYLKQCNNCSDCFNACPVNAIHNQDKFPWVDVIACDNFAQFGDDEIIPSMKYIWGKYINKPKLTDDEILKIKNKQDLYDNFQIFDIPGTININGQQKFIQYPICRECCSQPKCSKYNGKYPYDKYRYKIYG